MYSEHSGINPNEDGIVLRFLFRSRRLISVVAFSLLIVAIANFVWAHWQAPSKIARPQGVWASIDRSRYLLRLSGSKAIGSVLAPQLVTAWLTSIGASDLEEIRRVGASGIKLGETVVTAKLNGNPIMVEVKALGSADAFRDLANGAADIGMASREIDSSEVTRLMPLGYMRSAASEHILGVESIAVIVTQSNTVPSVTLPVLKKIFSGEIRNWSALGMKSQAIHLYAPGNNSGIYDKFASLVLGGVPIASASRYEDSEKLETDVAGDPGGIGFVGVSHVRDTRRLPVTDGNDVRHALPPISARYALSRRLYLYTAALPENTAAMDFVHFAESPEGQNIVRKNGLGLNFEEEINSSDELASTAPLQREVIKVSATEESVKPSLPPPAPAVIPPPQPLATIQEIAPVIPVTVTPLRPEPSPAPIPLLKVALPPPSAETITPVAPPALKIAPPPQPPPPVPPVAITSHAVTAADYPMASIHLKEQGKVLIKYLVTQDGSVGDCNVTTSSGKSLLDEAACAIVKRHWKFKPAMQAGKPVSEFLTAEVIFQLNEQVVKDSKSPLGGLTSLITGLL